MEPPVTDTRGHPTNWPLPLRSLAEGTLVDSGTAVTLFMAGTQFCLKGNFA
jgi:hypothetical protein